MELRMNQYQLPEKIGFNYEELKAEVQAKVSMYETLIYTEDTIKDAKADKAQLNKLKKALNDERIRLQKEYMIPFNNFKTQIDELISIIDKPVGLIDKQVKEYTEQKKVEKEIKIRELFEDAVFPDWVLFETILDQKWLNSSVSMSSIEKEMNSCLEKIEADLCTLSGLPEFAFESIEMYKQTLDINKAISEGKRLAEIQKRKEEALKTEEQHKLPASDEQLPGQIGFSDAESFDTVVKEATEPLKMWVSFKALMTTEDAFALRNFFESNGIEFQSV